MFSIQSGLMRPRGIIASALIGLAVAASASPAEAQIFGGIFAERFHAPLPGHYRGHYGYEPRYRSGIDPAAVVDLVRAEGFRQLTPPVYRGDVYVLEATDARGARVRLFVDADRGFIRGGQVIGRERAAREPPPRRRETARVAPIPRDPPIFRAPSAPESAAPPVAPKILNTPDTRRPQPRPPVAARPAPDSPALTNPDAPPKVLITPDTGRPQQRPSAAPRAPAQAQQPPRPAAPAAQPRRIEIGPPAALDDAPAQRRPAQPGINTVPPASLE